MKKENELQNKLVVIFKKKKIFYLPLLKRHKDFDAHKISCKAKFSIIDKNEIFILKK